MLNGSALSSRKVLVGGLIMLCCALVVLTLVAIPKPGRTALKSKGSPWENDFGWYSQAPADSEIGLVASHMKQFNARELYYPLGTFTFDQGSAKLAGGEGIYH